ncbi:cupin [Zavarzinia compransoris]|uniref:cupin n=1 Tax=Zavarzinia marina TaxID=2911065 RepID=UPI001F367D36|nr:cupin [Zavarzinia marina]MCF4164070.1 cupin [Zavarzinia marina]
MRFVDPRGFTAARAWGALDIARFDAATVRLHWTDAPYRWHVNDGEEVFVVLDGEVDMHWKDETGTERVTRMVAGDIAHAGVGAEHVAHPRGPARILVVETPGSV